MIVRHTSELMTKGEVGLVANDDTTKIYLGPFYEVEERQSL